MHHNDVMPLILSTLGGDKYEINLKHVPPPQSYNFKINPKNVYPQNIKIVTCTITAT